MKKNIGAVFVIFLLALGSFTLARDAMAGLAWNTGMNETALSLLRSDPSLAMALGRYYFGGEAYDLPKAKRAFGIAAAHNPAPVMAHYQLARIYFVEGLFDTALREANAELKEHPENFRTLYIRGLVFAYRGERGDTKRAESDFKNFVAWAPEEWAGYNDLAWILLSDKSFKEAKETVEAAFAEIPEARENPWLLNNLGLALLGLGDYKKARDVFSVAHANASVLTVEEWYKAYPGNDRVSAAAGLQSFKKAIITNLATTERKNSNVDNSF